MNAARPGQQEMGGVWRHNVAAVEAFLEAVTQFNHIALANGRTRITGLDYSRARAGWELSGTDMPPDLFAKVQMIESGVIAESSGT
ncbi:DUF1799 domain-containing protein [Phaeobacter sp. PT47_59]|uniref:DUF1799 domain-containing protein n=1 Tax=Phaeobacter sp. PT47_59 TaxID=3029979 RepID=UPI0023801904|nr:DUF1799 domain-containing protein [Phaeobacter sp. PT47_59]MDE4175803.1 DUF1799 domain-containing protein [Phaeobacter sp. PT47_59]